MGAIFLDGPFLRGGLSKIRTFFRIKERLNVTSLLIIALSTCLDAGRRIGHLFIHIDVIRVGNDFGIARRQRIAERNRIGLGSIEIRDGPIQFGNLFIVGQVV